jgi:Ca-activated chloride channel family protein
MTIGAPYLLFGLLAVPLAAIGYLLLERRRGTRARGWSRPAMEPNIVRRPPGTIRYVPAVLFLLALAFLLVGFARPERILASARTGGAVIALTFDVSGSMDAKDVAPNRIQSARALATRLVDELPSNVRVAVATFSDTVKLVVPPTFDRRAAIAGIPKAVTPLAGTAIGDAIDNAASVVVGAVGKGLPGSRHPPGAVVLFSDGAQTDVGTDPGDAAQQSLTQGIPVDAIAFGTPNGYVRQVIRGGPRGPETQTIAVPVDTETLRQVAQQTDGTFLKGTAGANLSALYRDLGAHTARGRQGHDVSRAAAGAALLFTLAGIALSGLWFGRLA